MKILTLKLGDKTYTTGRLTAYLSKEVIRAAKQSIGLAKRQSEMGDIDETDPAQLELAESLMDAVEELNDRKTWIVCEAYGNKFTPDDIERELTTQEIDAQIGSIMAAITGTMGKN